MVWLYVPLALLLYNSTGYLASRRLFLNCVTSLDYEWKLVNYGINCVCLVGAMWLAYSLYGIHLGASPYLWVGATSTLIVWAATARGRSNMVGALLGEYAPTEILMRLVASMYPTVDILKIRGMISNRIGVKMQDLVVSASQFDEFLEEELKDRTTEELRDARNRFARASDLLA